MPRRQRQGLIIKWVAVFTTVSSASCEHSQNTEEDDTCLWTVNSWVPVHACVEGLCVCVCVRAHALLFKLGFFLLFSYIISLGTTSWYNKTLPIFLPLCLLALKTPAGHPIMCFTLSIISGDLWVRPFPWSPRDKKRTEAPPREKKAGTTLSEMIWGGQARGEENVMWELSASWTHKWGHSTTHNPPTKRCLRV